MGIWEIGKQYKIITKGGTVLTARAEGKEGSLLIFKDKNGIQRGLSPDAIREIRRIGEDDGNE